MNPILEVRGVTKRFGGLLAVSDVSFSMAEGEILGGPSPDEVGSSTRTGRETQAATDGRGAGRPESHRDRTDDRTRTQDPR